MGDDFSCVLFFCEMSVFLTAQMEKAASISFIKHLFVTTFKQLYKNKEVFFVFFKLFLALGRKWNTWMLLRFKITALKYRISLFPAIFIL